MAEFKLGRIKFVWQGTWTTGTTYAVDDVVRNGGKSYMCVVNHTSSALFATDLAANPTRWNLIADGTLWRGNWATSTYYSLGDQVKYGGLVYVCNTAHTSSATTALGLEADQAKWDLFATSPYWYGAWTTNRRYRVNDFVTYGGYTYICNTYHTSAATTTLGLEADASKWDVFNAGVIYLGDWSGSSVRYRVNDVVRYGADLWICTTQHTSSASFDQTKWSVFVNGFQYENSWSSGATYQIGDTVTYGGYSYVAKTNNTNKVPSTNASDWDPFTTGFNFKGDWAIGTSYKNGEVTRVGGYTYVCILDSAAISVTASATSSVTSRVTLTSTSGMTVGQAIVFGTSALSSAGISANTIYYIRTIESATDVTLQTTPGGTLLTLTATLSAQSVATTVNWLPGYYGVANWTRLNSGLRWTENPQTYTGVTTSNVTVTNGAAAGAQFTVTRTKTVYTLTRTANGTNYTTGDIIKILGTSVGGVSPANDIAITVTATAGAISSQTYSGVSVTWTSGIAYTLGDIVFFGANSYACIQDHLALTANRPDNDITGTYWSALANGAEVATLTTAGDTFYYGANGPARLPVGSSGQVLRVTDGYPAWAYFGVVNNVVYVGPNGADNPYPTNGGSIDSPWKTVRYAAKQVEDGYLNSNAKQLLIKNKQFIMKEVTQWIVNRYTVNITASSSVTNAFTVGSTANLVANMPIVFSSTVGGVTAGTTYYVKTIIDSVSFTISSTLGGTTFTLTTQSGAMTGTLSYNSATCERDVGILVEAVAYDMSHGGTSKSTAAARSYFTAAGNAYITSNLGTQVIQTVAAYGYLTTLIGNVLANAAPAVNYQSTNGIAVGNRAIQIIDTTIPAETGTTALATNLLAIVTNALTSGSASTIDPAINPGTTISVKTGTYTEVLPIVVPEYTAIVGDELRGTVVQPSLQNDLLANDKTKTISALNRIKAVVPTLIANSAITPTSGNTQTQVTSLPAGDVGSYTASSLTLTATTVTSNLITVSSTASLTVGTPITPASTVGGLTGGTTYYVLAISNGTQFTVTTTTPVTNQASAVVLSTTTGQNVTITTQPSAVTSIGANATTMYNAINTGTAPTSWSLPWPAGYNTATLTSVAYSTTGSAVSTLNFGDGVKQILQNYAFIKDDVGTYLSITAPYNTVWSALGAGGQANCKRDVGYILDAVVYDLVYGGNTQSLIAGSAYYSNYLLTIGTNEKAAMLASLSFLKTEIGLIVTNSAITPQTGNVTARVTTGTAGSAAAALFAQARIQDVYDWINNGTAPTAKTPDLSWAGATLLASYNALSGKRTEIQADTVSWVKKFFQSLTFNTATCSRDAGLIVDALALDLYTGSNFASVSAGRAYLRATSSAQTVIANQKSAELGAINFIAQKSKTIATAGATAQIQQTIDDITQYITGTSYTEVHGTTTYNNTLSIIKGAEILRANKTFLAYEATAWITASYGGTVSTLTTGTNLVTVGVNHNFTVGDPVVFTGTSAGNIVINTTYYVYTTPGLTTLTVSASPTYAVSVTNTTATTNVVTVASTFNLAVGMNVVFTGSLGGITSGTTYYITSITGNNTITLSASLGGSSITLSTASGSISGTATTGSVLALTTVGSPSLTVRYSYNAVSCRRDMAAYIDAIVDDLQFTGNYKSLRAARLYLNAVTGSQLENMYLVRNGTGIRNQTMTGLSGTIGQITTTASGTGSTATLTFADNGTTPFYPGQRIVVTGVTPTGYNTGASGAIVTASTRTSVSYANTTTGAQTVAGVIANSYGTKRPTAGAFVSLDPGFGPNDSRVWITSRSPYSQNCTMFGTACVGGKIDAALHNGGYKSTVANDFTTILSDGIGVWCTGSGSLTELVSVFNYYGYAGYLAELGGRIRATNGNSSYGTYGVIAEGTDSYESAKYGILNNRGNNVQITNVVTDGTNQILRYEFGNAGMNYTNITHNISGAGFNATAAGDEFRDSSVMETRIIDVNDGFGYGGAGYLSAANAAQNGDVGYITIAAADTQLSTAYVGMRIQITAGTGVGQYANILTYNNGSKIAQIYKDSFTNLTVTATTVTTNVVTVASTATLYANMPIYLGSAIGGLSANTVYYVKSGFTATQFSVSTTPGGTAVTLSTASGSVTLYAAGWDHVVPGRATVSAVDLTTTYIIEPRISYTAPGYTATARTLPATTTWGSATYGANRYLAISNNGTAAASSADGKTWTAAGALTNTTWADVAYGGGQGAVGYAVIGGLGGQGAVLTAVMGTGLTADQVQSVNIVNGGFGYTTAPTIVFTPVSGGSGAVATCTVYNGTIDTITVTIPGSGYTVAPTVSAATDRVTQVVMTAWGKDYPAGTTTVTFSGGGSSNQATGTAVLTNGGISSVTIGNSGGSGYTSAPTITFLDTAAKFVAVPTTAAGGTTVTQYQTVAGAIANTAWSNSATAITNGSYTSVDYGGGYYVTVGGTASSARSTDGTNWASAGTLTTLTGATYVDVVYGSGQWVALASNGATMISTTAGSTWVAGGTLPGAITNWDSLAYGNGRWVAIAGTGAASTNVAYSVDNGATWTASPAGIIASQTWQDISYGQGVFFAVASGTNVAATSPDGINWTARTMPASSNWSNVVFGNTNSNPLWVAVSATSGTVAASMNTGAQATGRMKVTSNSVVEVRMVEPGSSYPKGNVSATTVTTNLITVDTTENLVDSQPIEFTGATTGGLALNTTYYVIGSTITSTQFKVSATAGSATPVTLSTTTGLTGTYRAGPIVTHVDPNKTRSVSLRVRTSDGAVANPTFTNRGTGNTTATATGAGDGYSDLYQPSNFINVSGLYSIPSPGANIEFASIPNTWFKLVAVSNILGTAGNYTATFQINPSLSVLNAPAHGDRMTTKLAYSQVRLTGHDFLYIGTGNASQTNYPYVNTSTAVTANQTIATGGGRVFFTSTDQDGNFNVGNLFGVQQSTGTATLNASAFNLSGLQSLQLGTVTVGAGSAVITQFSTDPYFTANSDSILPTQRAIKSYITAQIGGGQSSLNVNTLTSGVIYVANNSISTTTGVEIKVKAKMNFTAGIDGAPVALGFFMQK